MNRERPAETEVCPVVVTGGPRGTRYRLELLRVERPDGSVLSAELSADQAGRGRVILVEEGGRLRRPRSVCIRASETLQLASALDAAARKVDRFGRVRG